MTANIAAEIRETLRQFFSVNSSVNHWYVGFSGGLDSSILLSVASELLPPDRLTALHINHGIQADAHDWQEHCRQFADRLNIQFKLHQVVCDGQSEASARDARYDVFAQVVQEREGLLLAHHRNDQAETLLMRLMRGSGAIGLSGMPPSRPIGLGRLYRPLLEISHHQILAAANDIKLSWVVDPSNDQVHYTRNWIRHSLMPLLSERWPQVLQRLSDSASRMSESSELLADLAAIDSDHVILESQVSLDRLLTLSVPRRKNILYFWLRNQGVPIPHHSRLESMATAPIDSSGEWQFGAFKVRAFDGSLFLTKDHIGEASAPLDCALREGGVLFSGGQLLIESSDVGFEQGLCVHVRTRQPGDRVLIKQRGGHVTIKKFMNEQRVPYWLRDCWPVVTLGSTVIAIPGLWSHPDYLIQGGLSLNWRV